MIHQSKRILFVVTSTETIGPKNRPSGYEFSEVAHPYLVFTANGHRVDFASIKGGRPPEDGFNSEDPASVIFRESTGFNDLNESKRLDQIVLDLYDAVFFPGGLGPMDDMLHDPIVKKTVAHFYETDRVVGAVCHGPAALLNVSISDGTKLLDGKRVAAFTTAEEIGHSEHDVPFMLDAEMEKQGAIHSFADPFAKHVVIDGLLITGRNPASAVGVAQEMASSMNGQQSNRNLHVFAS
ncbi:MAG: type 1 glutamine amidotransferase domain-containing protein [Phycisphaerales bacterium]|nr:type 1 glutamine amidotransferase domain-containing protein [Phycisphaerales bacterium]